MKTPQDKLDLALKLCKAQSALLAIHYKWDMNVYSDAQMKKFDRLEKARDMAIEALKESCCTCEDYGFIGKHYCPIHVKTEG
jgi:hypothetical protein